MSIKNLEQSLSERTAFYLLLTILVVAGSSRAESEVAQSSIPSNWARPIAIPGVANLYKVSKNLYRSAQPTAEGMQNLEKKLGIKTVINLRLLHSDQDELRGTKMNHVHIPVKTWRVKKRQVIEFLRVVIDAKNQPVLVHCKHGADRTGTMVAFYRILVQKWSKEQALDEMIHGGFNYHSIWINLPEMIEDADLDDYAQAL